MTNEPNPCYWYDGALVASSILELAIDEPALLYGATVFTTMRVYESSLTHPLTHYCVHLDRLKNSIASFDWQQPNWQSLQRGAVCLSSRFRVLRIAIFPDGRELITGRNLPPDLAQRQQQGITAWIAEAEIYRRNLANHKTGNYLGAYLALQKARQLGAQEAILLDRTGNWLETSTGNLWGWKDGCWYTPSLDCGILPGIIRSQLLRWLQKNHTPVIENCWTPEFVKDLGAIAYSNCVVEVMPIKTII
jgi:4-amino-4-deoxychorismate lyase